MAHPATPPRASHRTPTGERTRGGHSARLAPGRRAALTLVELLVVIAIIVILLGILLVILGAVRRLNLRHTTESTMGHLHMALDAYQTKWPIPIEPRTEALYFDSVAPKNRLAPMRYFMFKTLGATPTDGKGSLIAAAAPNEVVDAFSRIGTEFVKPLDRDGDGKSDVCTIVNAQGAAIASGYLWTVRDAWGTEFDFRMAIPPAGRVKGAPTDAGTTFTYGTPPVTVPMPYGDDALPNWEFPLFASAGPDKAWGVLAGGQRDQADPDARDNLYSCDKSH